MKCISCFSNLF